MKQFKSTFLAFMLICSMPAFSQSNIWINGTVYSENDSIQAVIPFATVKLYSDSTLTNLAYFTVCGPLGNYTIKPYDHTKSYYVIAEAPNYAPRRTHISPIPEIWDGKPFSGNATTNIRLQPVSSLAQYETIVMSKEDLPGTAASLYDILLSIEGIDCDADGWFTPDERGVLFCINGNVVGTEQAKAFNQIPTNVIAKISIYETKDNPSYGKAIDITLTIGSQAEKPDYRLSESQFFY